MIYTAGHKHCTRYASVTSRIGDEKQCYLGISVDSAPPDVLQSDSRFLSSMGYWSPYTQRCTLVHDVTKAPDRSHKGAETRGLYTVRH